MILLFGQQAFGRHHPWLKLLCSCHLANRHLANPILGWNGYDLVIWPTGIWLIKCLFETILILLFGQQAFGQHNPWLKRLWSCHLANRHLADTILGWNCCDLVIWPTGIWLIKCLIEIVVILSSGRKAFGTSANRHFVDKKLGSNCYESLILLTGILPTQCLVKTSVILSFGWQTFDQHHCWLKVLLFCHLAAWHLVDPMELVKSAMLLSFEMILARTVIAWNWHDSVIWL